MSQAQRKKSFVTVPIFVTVPDVCAAVHCENGAICIEENGHGVCKCPVGTEGETCHSGQ